jgi:integral membrane sensor domain MASE1
MHFNDKVSVLNFTDEVATIGSIIGLILVAFSKLKVEDEYVSKVRLESLQWAIYLNFGLLIIATIFVHGMAYFNVIIFNMFTPLIFFNIRFHFILFIKSKFEN